MMAAPHNSTPPAASARLHWADTLKAVLLMLVVAGHVLAKFRGENETARLVWDVIYVFHMPAFAFLSGLLARPDEAGWTRKHLIALAVPLLVFTPLFELGHFAAKGTWSRYAIGLSPYWILWFLFAQGLWTAALPFVGKRPLALPVAFLLALVCGLFDWVGETLSLSRALVFFPFYLMGYQLMDRGLIAKLMDRPRMAWPIFAGLVVALFLAVHAFSPKKQMLLASESFSTLGATVGDGLELRAKILLLAVLAIAVLLMAVPRGRSFLSQAGRNSIVIYILHAPLVAFAHFAWGDWFEQLQGPVPVVLTLVIAAALTLLLGTAVLRRWFDAVMSPLERLLTKMFSTAPQPSFTLR